APGSERKSTRLTAAGERAVRVNAVSLNRLMGLAGEYRVETRWLEPFALSLRQLKNSQLQLADLLERQQNLERADISETVRAQLLYDTQQQRTLCEQQLNA